MNTLTITPTTDTPSAAKLGSIRWLLWSLAFVMMILTSARISVCILRSSRLLHESGVFTAMAMDFAHGVLYRPVIGPDGYGGTRYFPLHVILHGTLIRLGLQPIHAGFVMLICSLVLLVASLYRLMRNLGVPPGIAIPAIMIGSGTASAGMAITMIRGDLLPAALNLAALSIVAGLLKPISINPPNSKSITLATVVAGILFALAFLAKITTVFGCVAAILSLWMTRRHRQAILIIITTGGLSLLGILICQILSHGNFLQNLRACAGGGSGPPLWILQNLLIVIPTVEITNDPIGLAVLLAGACAFAVAPAKLRLGLPGLMLILTGLVTLSLFVTPGIDKNHLFDVQLAAVVFLAVSMSVGDVFHLKLGQAMIGFLLIAELFSGWVDLHGDLSEHVEKTYRPVWRTAVAGQKGPVLTDYTLLPVLFNQRPFVLDDFMVPVIGARQPKIWTDLYKKIDSHFFIAVILKADPTRKDRQRVWGHDFTAHLKANYTLTATQGDFRIYRPIAFRGSD